MSSSSIFKSLRELFPQVDLRILRAISIEHEEDINEAIEFILLEVLPSASTAPDFSPIRPDTDDPAQELRERAKGPEYITIPDDAPVSPFGMPHHIGEAENRDANSRSEPGHEASDYNNSSGLSLNHRCEEDENLFYNVHNQNDQFEPLSDGGSESIVLTEHHTKFPVELNCANMALQADVEEMVQVRNEENSSVQLDEQTKSSAVYYTSESPMEYGSEKENDINIQLNVCDELSGCSSDACRPLNLHDLETVLYTPPALTCMLSSSGVSEKDHIYQDSITENFMDAIDDENHNSISLDVNSLELSSYENDECNILPTSLATRSGHAVSTDLLEDSIKDAKNSKNSLISSLESMVSMMREVELLEGKAKQAKEEALVTSHHILSKVAELQQIVKQSKDENDMHSGEVYGERSILATEARELQSRLLRMSEERTKYLSVTEEIFRALDARQAAAKDEIAAADFVKRVEEKRAQKALKEQELMRDSVLAESQKLQQEAEENSKLREFLMDRGHVVDSLQGEIAIICEDILSLKQRVDGHIPLAKSTISTSSSRTSSMNSPDHRGSPSSPSSLTNKETPESRPAVNFTDLNNLVRFSNPLDDWELCDK